ncbi:putative leucine-rich repeat receptor-like protein kinase At2g19210 [Impatiens glandulifera]|uniref:putative leucine-rich repeat receptor-like protein kinase At2g19210 n=1 Tax=Impatiens glandulifera TaxID=253017 RepID=UPI001FB13D34|nr:putative leucine-rich repeat receptor-like protein kinase At2g19210 [Impatiens glandulifera]
MANCMTIFQFLIHLIFLQLILAHAQQQDDDQSGFISLDCGRPNGYTDRDTGLRYNSDYDFIDSGVSHMIAPEYQSKFLYQQFLYVRSFPKGTRNCYTLKVPPKANVGSRSKFLIRGRFLYANYDNNHSLPSFDLQIGVDLWDRVQIYNESVPIRKEIIYVPKSDFIQVCLINTNSGIPFISALEIRPLNNTIYRTKYSLNYYQRWDLASSTNSLYRYKDDVYDRIWLPVDLDDSTSTLATTSRIMPSEYQLPNVVMNTASVPKNPNDSLVLTWDSTNNITDQFYIYLHFAELTPNSTRIFDIYVNEKLLFGHYSPKYLHAQTTTGQLDVSSTYKLSLNATKNSLLPPLLNAIDLYTIKQTLNSQTNDQDGK